MSLLSEEAVSHTEWSRRRFRRLDRKGLGVLTDSVLTSEEFVKVVKEAIGVPLQSHAVMTATGLRDWITRHATQGQESRGLEFETFSALMWKLKHLSAHPRMEASFIFALFDSDGDGKINREEFKQIYQFFTKQTPPAQTIMKLWIELDDLKRGFLDKRQYMQWLQRDFRPEGNSSDLELTSSSLFAIPEEPESPASPAVAAAQMQQASGSMSLTVTDFSSKALSSVFEFFKASSHSRRTTKTGKTSGAGRRSWFPRHHISDNQLNDAIHPYLRDYFSRPRSEWCTPEGRSRLLGQFTEREKVVEHVPEATQEAEAAWDTRCSVVESRINEEVNPCRRKYF